MTDSKTYATWQFPNYVHDFFGPPLTLTRLSNTAWRVRGSLTELEVQSGSAIGARTKIREHVQKTRQIDDKRITRHLYNPNKISTLNPTNQEIAHAVNVLKASGQFTVTRIQPPDDTCRTCWGTGRAPSSVGWVVCPTCQ